MSKLKGIVPPLLTPLTPTGELDIDGLGRLIEHVISGGVHGVFILGTTGEGPALGRKLQKAMIENTCRLIAGRRPVLVGISAAALDDSVWLASIAKAIGASAAVAAPPCYYPLGEPELFDYYESLVKCISPLPLYLYNMPSMTKISMKPSTIIRLAQIPGIIGYKDSSGNMCDLHEVILALQDREDFSIFVGPEELLGEAVFFGADGGVCGGANLTPQLFVAMYDAACQGDRERMRTLQKAIFSQRRLYQIGHHQSSLLKGLKCAVSMHHLCTDDLVAPFHHFEMPERQAVERILSEIG